MKPSASQALDSVIPITGKSVIDSITTGFSSGIESSDHFILRNGIEYAGTHLILDLWEARELDNLELMESTMRDAVTTCGATLLHIHLHHFTPNGGISGVAVLAESHISVHTWPEREFAAFDIFMCGDARPEEAIAILMRAFSPKTMQVTEALRGVGGHA